MNSGLGRVSHSVVGTPRAGGLPAPPYLTLANHHLAVALKDGGCVGSHHKRTSLFPESNRPPNPVIGHRLRQPPSFKAPVFPGCPLSQLRRRRPKARRRQLPMFSPAAERVLSANPGD